MAALTLQGRGLTIAGRQVCNLCALALVLAGSFMPSTLRASAGDQVNFTELGLARDYVLAACVMDRYPKTPLADEADAWASGLVERGGLSADAYAKLARLAHDAPKAGVTRLGVEMRLQSCVDFVNSRKVREQLKSILR